MSKLFSTIVMATALILLTTLMAAAGEGESPVLKDNTHSTQDWTPEWAKKVVWYQIFPERFRNGDLSNDPKREDLKGSWPHDCTSPWQVHPWTSDWYRLQPYEKGNGQDIWFNLQRRRYGGDIQGIMDRLDYLQDLGITAIYLNPVFESPSLHKYDAKIYHHVDANFGPDPAGDRKLMASETLDEPSTWRWTAADRQMLTLIKEVHRRGMRIIFDGVFNHIGISSPFFQDVVKNQQRSKYADWFSIASWDDPLKGTKLDYDGWFGFKELPEWREDNKGIVEGPKKYIFNITGRWMDPDGDGNPADGIDGWRLDVAFCVKHPFWKAWSRHVKSINPEIYMTAEVIDTVAVNRPYLEGDEFSAVMNYNFAFACSEYFIDEKKKIPTTVFDRSLEDLRGAYDLCVAYVMQNLLDSHDSDRYGSRIVNRDLVAMRDWSSYCQKAKGSNTYYNTRKPVAEEIVVQKLMVIFQMTYLGAPMVYYGDEAGMWGATDPCCRKPMVWDDLQYEDEAYLPDGGKREIPDPVSFNRDLFSHYKKLIQIRNSHKALQIGSFKTLLTDDNNDIYGFARDCESEHIIVLLNNGKSGARATLKIEKGSYEDILNNGTCLSTGEDGILSTEIPAKWGMILVKK